MSANIDRTRRKQVVRLGFLTGLFFCLQSLAHAQPQVAFVMSLKGEWILNSSQRLNPGSPLPANGIIRLRNRQGGEFIEIADRGGRPIITRRCDSEDCNQPVRIPASRDNVVVRFFSAAMAILGRDPGRVAVLISRGGELREAVVPFADGQADLSSVFASQSRRTYLIRFVPKGANAPPNAPIVGPVSVEWNPNRLCVVTVQGLKSGLYEVQLLSNEDREPLEPGTEAWVLFVRPEPFGDAFCEFHEAQALTKSWSESVRQSTKRQFLRAMLSKLETQ